MDPYMLDTLKLVLQFAVLPLAGFGWAHYRMSQAHETAIAVLKSEHTLVKASTDREFKETKESLRSILSKLDEIHKALPR